MGIYNTIGSFIASIISIMTGYLASENWKSAFSYFWIMAAFCFLIFLSGMSIATFRSTYIAEHELGTSVCSGYATAVATYGSLAGSLVFGFLYGKLKRHIMELVVGCYIVACALFYFVPGGAAFLIATFIAQFAFGTLFVFIFVYYPLLTSKAAASKAIGLATAVQAAATFFPTYFVTGLQSVLGTDSFTALMPILCGIIVVVGAAEIFLPKKLKSEYAQAGEKTEG